MSSTTRAVLVLAAVFVAVALIAVLSRPADSPRGGTGEEMRVDPTREDGARLRGRDPAEAPPVGEGAPALASEPAEDSIDPPDAEWRLEVEVVSPNGAAPAATRLQFGGAGANVKGSAGSDGRATLVVRGSGRLAVLPSGDWAPWTSELLHPPPSGRLHLAIELEIGLEIGGAVLDPEGRPVAARIQAESVAGWTWIDRLPPWTWRARTGKNGSFRIRGLLPGSYRLRVQLRPRRGDGELPGLLPPPLEVEAGTEGVVVRLLPASGIVLRLVDADSGEAVDGMADVYHVEDTQDRHRNFFRGSSLVLDEAPGTRLRLRIRVEGYEPSEILELVFPEPGAGEARDVWLRRDPQGLVNVTFHLMDEKGRIVPAITATRWFDRGSTDKPHTFGLGDTHSVPDGVLVLPLPPGRHRFDFAVEVKGDEDLRWLLRQHVTLELETGKDVEREVVFERGGGIRIHHPKDWRGGLLVRRPDGTKAPRFSIRMLEAGGRVFFPVPRGPWVLTFLLADGARHEVPVEVPPGQYADVRFDPTVDVPR